MRTGRRSTRSAIPIDRGTQNVYADLGLSDSESMLVKAKLVSKISEIIEQRRLTQEQAAKILRLTQPKVSRLLRVEFRGMSERRLLRCLTCLGRDIQIVVKHKPRQRREGRLSVRFT
jgi:predicted XRE-type DNA-binding protein